MSTVRIPELSPITEAEAADELVIVDKSDTSSHTDGTDKKISARNFIENIRVRPIDDVESNLPLKQWIQNFKTSTEGLENRTQNATTNRIGVVQYATNAQVINKAATNRVLSPANLALLSSTEDLAGLIALASGDEVNEGQENNKAITPYTALHNLLGSASLGTDSWVFSFPSRNSAGDIRVELVIQVGETTFNTMETGQSPTINFNHIHQEVSFDVTFPQQFSNRVLMVIPIPFETNPNEYEEGSDFWIRPKSTRLNGATFRASRISGTSPGGQTAGCRYIAIGY